MLNFIPTKVIAVVKNLVLSPQGGAHAGEVLLCEVATTLPNKPFAVQGTQTGYRHKKFTAMAKSCSPGGNNPSSLGFTIVLAEVGFYAFVSILVLEVDDKDEGTAGEGEDFGQLAHYVIELDLRRRYWCREMRRTMVKPENWIRISEQRMVHLGDCGNKCSGIRGVIFFGGNGLVQLSLHCQKLYPHGSQLLHHLLGVRRVFRQHDGGLEGVGY